MLYPIVIHQEGDSAYGVIVPDIPGCFSAGDSLEEALANTREAIDLQLESFVEDDEEIPNASDMKSLSENPDYEGGFWAIVDIDVTQYLGTADRLNITLPHRLVHRIDKAVTEKKAFKNRSQFLAEASLKLLAEAR